MSSKRTWETRILRAGSFRLDGGSMFGVIPKPLWSKWSAPDDDNRIRLDCNCALLQDGDSTVLVETGYGEKWTSKDRGIFDMEQRTIVDALREIGVEADQITHVIVSHLHFDHAGALTRWVDPSAGDEGGFMPGFPDARIIVQRQELDDAMLNRSTMTRTYLRSHLDPVSEMFDVVVGEAEPLPGIVLKPVPGHTWGQQSISWSSSERSFVFPGDLCPTLNHAHPAASMAYDMEPWTSMREKQAFFQEHADSGRIILLDHDPEDPLATVISNPEKPGRFHLEAVPDT